MQQVSIRRERHITSKTGRRGTREKWLLAQHILERLT